MVPFFDCRGEARGIIAIGQMATGVIAIGQMATGVIAVGQIARGFVAVGQGALGVITVGQLSVGVVRSWGMLATAAKASGLLGLSIVPQPPELPETPTLPVAVLAAGEQTEGWIRVTAAPDGQGGIQWAEDGSLVRDEISVPSSLKLLRQVRGPRQLLLKVRSEEVFDDNALVNLRSAAPSRRRLRVMEFTAVDGRSGTSVVGWIFRAIVGVALAMVVGQYALRPLIELFMA